MISAAVLDTLQALHEENAGCLFVRDAGYAGDGIEDTVAAGYATGPHQHLDGEFYELTAAGRAAWTRHRRERAGRLARPVTRTAA